jgi:hypothetical protein
LERATLFFSNLLSGFMLFAVPYIVNVLLALPIADYYNIYSAIPASWPMLIGANVVIMLYTYAITVLAGMVSGNTPVHLMTAAIFNFAWMFLYSFGMMLADRFLIGLSQEGQVSEVITYLHPVVYYMVGWAATVPVSSIGPGAMIAVYAAVSALFVAVSWLLYRSFKAERAGDSILYRAVEYIFACVVATVGLFIGGELLGRSGIFGSGYIIRGDLYPGYGSMDYVDGNYIIGAFIGAAVAFVVATMILRKSPRVFDLRMLRRFGAFAVAAAVLFVCVMTNITGFETRVPAASNVSVGAVSTSGLANVLPPYKQGLDYFSGTSYIPIKGEGDIKALEEFHRGVLKDKAYMTVTDEYGNYVADVDADYVGETDISFAYALKGGGSESRRYMLTNDYMAGSNAFARLMSCDSVKGYMSIKNLLGYDALNVPEIFYMDMDNNAGVSMGADPDTAVREKLTGDALKELAACLDEDYRAMGANDMMHPGAELFTLYMSSKRAEGVLYESAAAATSGKGEAIRDLLKRHEWEEYSVYYTVTEKSEKTIAWLKEAGIYDSIIKSVKELENQRMKEEAEAEPEEMVDPG